MESAIQTRSRWAFFGALGIHVAIVAALLVPSVTRKTPANAPRDEDAIADAIELDDDAVAVVAGEEAKANDDVKAGALAAREANAVAPRAENAPRPPEPSPNDPATAATSAPNATSPTAEAPPGDGPVLLAAPSIGLPVAGANPFMGHGALPDVPHTRDEDFGPRRAPPTTARPEAPTRAEAKAAVEGTLKRDARERERALGLGPEGPVLTALGEATYATETSVKGRAVFLAIANGEGDVVGLSLVSSDGNAGWSSAAKAALAALKGQKLRMPAGSKRAEMKIEVVSEWKMPSGHDPGVDVDLFHIPLKKGEGDKSTAISILDPLPKVRVDQLEIAPGVKVPIVSVGVDLLMVKGDPADIGAKPRRVVHTRLVDSKVL